MKILVNIWSCQGHSVLAVWFIPISNIVVFFTPFFHHLHFLLFPPTQLLCSSPSSSKKKKKRKKFWQTDSIDHICHEFKKKSSSLSKHVKISYSKKYSVKYLFHIFQGHDFQSSRVKKQNKTQNPIILFLCL